MVRGEGDELVARARTGDEAAWAELYGDHAERLVIWLRHVHHTDPAADAEDIAAVAVHALTGEHAPDTDLVLTGPEALSYDDIAAIMTEVTGRLVVHRSLSDEQMRDRLAAQIPEEFAAMLAGLDRAIAEGSEDRVTDAVQRLTGRPARTFRAFLEEKQ